MAVCTRVMDQLHALLSMVRRVLADSWHHVDVAACADLVAILVCPSRGVLRYRHLHQTTHPPWS